MMTSLTHCYTLLQGYGVQTVTPQVTGDKSLEQRCNVHSAMVLRALEETRLVISCVI